MENLKSFYTGWASGHDLASQDNQRYTTLNAQALSNTGAQNRQMLEHVNDVDSMVLMGKDKFGQPLLDRQKKEMTDMVNRYQMPYSQGVFTPAPWSPRPEDMAPVLSPPAPRPALMPIPSAPPHVAPPPMPAAVDLSRYFGNTPAYPEPPQPVAPSISSQMQLPPVTAPAMPPMQQAQLSMPPQAPQMPVRKKSKKKVTVKQAPRQGITQGNALTPELLSLPSMGR